MRLFTVFSLTISLFSMSVNAAEQPNPKLDLGANAAMKYWEGFALLPSLDHDQERIMEQVLETRKNAPFDPAAMKLIERSELSRKYLHRGAKLARCDWSLDYDDGMRLVLPHLSKSLTLSRLTALHARHEFERGHWQTGWEDVIAILKLARHIDTTPIMIGNLVGYRIESMAIDAASPWLPELKKNLPENAFDVVESLPPVPTLSQLMLTETEIGPVWLIHEMKQAEERLAGGWKTVWTDVLLTPNEDQQNPLRDLAQSVKSYDQAQKLMEDHLVMNAQLATLAGLPWDEFDEQYPEFLMRTKVSHPQAGFLLPNMEKFVPTYRRTLVQTELFKAAWAIVQGGPEKLGMTHDPFGNGPFEYRPLPGGFELKSKLIFKTTPVTLTAGRPPKS